MLSCTGVSSFSTYSLEIEIVGESASRHSFTPTDARSLNKNEKGDVEAARNGRCLAPPYHGSIFMVRLAAMNAIADVGHCQP